ncbi:ATP-binding protein [Methylophaga sp.]|uniref:ATP-binding protein n=1 Tax=Methylophaga sp. TaxID=2024840 RepID=UPI003A8E32A2
MAIDVWLPVGFEPEKGVAINRLIFHGIDWQIFSTDNQVNLIVATPEISQRWIGDGLLNEDLLKTLSFAGHTYKYLTSHSKYSFAPVEKGIERKSKNDAIAFAHSLRATREVSDKIALNDALYLEQYSKLIPTYTIEPRLDDEVILGRWLSGGVRVSTESFRRLSQLIGWLTPQDLSQVIGTAGLSVPADTNLLSKKRPNRIAEKTSPTRVTEVSDSKKDSKESKTQVFSLPGRPKLESFFNEHIIDIIFNHEKYQALGIDFPSAVILHGPPGCGKTYAVEKLIEFIDWPSYSIDSNSIGSPYIHETGKKISEIFDKAIENAPSVIVIDEMESFLSDRQGGGSSNQHHVEEVAEFLRRIPQALENRVLIVAMTNLIDVIDPAILRRGRFDHLIEVEMPSRIEVEKLLLSELEKLPTTSDISIEKQLKLLTGKALSDTAFVLREAARLAAKSGQSQLNQECLDSALHSLPSEKKEKGRGIGFVLDD